MPVIRPGEAATYEAHGSRFSSYVAPSRGSRQLCAWRLIVPAGLTGTAHRPTREEVLLVQDGDLAVSIGGQTTHLAPGDVVLVPRRQHAARRRRHRGSLALGHHDTRHRSGPRRRQPPVTSLGGLTCWLPLCPTAPPGPRPRARTRRATVITMAPPSPRAFRSPGSARILAVRPRATQPRIRRISRVKSRAAATTERDARPVAASACRVCAVGDRADRGRGDTQISQFGALVAVCSGGNSWTCPKTDKCVGPVTAIRVPRGPAAACNSKSVCRR